jgi:DNA-binding SARP family transcriptional activator/tetratricopeptide (TPR) repeat protein
MADLEFRVLGPVQALREGQPVKLTGRTIVNLLAALLLSSNRPVSPDTLYDLVWGDELPEHPLPALHSLVSRLRRLLGGSAVHTLGGGYQISVPPDALDLLRFDQLVAAATVAAHGGEALVAVSLLDQALDLWSPPALANVDSAALMRRGTQVLTERYLTAQEKRAELRLSLEQYPVVISELTGLVAMHPFHEPLAGQLMLGLYRGDRQAEAITAYQDLRQRLRDHLGVDPGEALQQLYQGILRRDPSLDLPAEAKPAAAEPPAAVLPAAGQPGGEPAPESVQEHAMRPAYPVPRQLPPDPGDFTGREREMAEITGALTEAGAGPAGDGAPPRAVRIVVLTGPGGIGKTALAIHAGHQVADAFPDGQIYADAKGAGDTADIMGDILRAFGMPGSRIPDNLPQRLGLYRSVAAGKSFLLVLDNVSSERGVLDLLPTGPRCGVIVTARPRLAGLPGGQLVELGTFGHADSARLLGQIIGQGRIDKEQAALAELVRLSSGLPLALRIIGARLAAKPHWRLGTLARRLALARRRLDELTYDDLDVRATISLSYAGLAADAKVMLRRLGLLDAPDFPLWAGAAVLDVSLERADEICEQLVDAQLLDVAGSPVGPRYQLHDLVRDYMREAAAAEETAGQRAAAVTRALGGWLAVVEDTCKEFLGGDFIDLSGRAARWRPDSQDGGRVTAGDPLAWLAAERAAIGAAVRQAAALSMDELCWELAWTSSALLEFPGYFDDIRGVQECALHVARQAGNTRGEAVTLVSVSARLLIRPAFAEAAAACRRAAGLFATAGDSRGKAIAGFQLGVIDAYSGRFQDAADQFRQSGEVLERAGDKGRSAQVQRGLAQTHLWQGREQEALRCIEDGLELAVASNSRRAEALLLQTLGWLHIQRGQFHQAAEVFSGLLGLTRSRGDITAEAWVLTGLGEALTGQVLAGPVLAGPVLAGRVANSERTRRVLTQALQLGRDLGDELMQARVLLNLGRLESACGCSAVAAAYLHESLDILGRVSMPAWREQVRQAIDQLCPAAARG